MIHPLPFTDSDLRAYALQIGAPDAEEAAAELARAIASSPSWSRIPGCSLLVRRSPAAIAVVGELTPEQLAEIRAQARAASRRLHSFRYVSYDAAEAACEVLAARLLPLLQSPQWEGCRFRAIPRGGHIVLGMLATILALPHWQLEHCSNPQTPLVLIDDCVLTGVRLRQQLEARRAERVMVAHLYSHPAVRRAVLDAEPTVVSCVAAHDLASGPDGGPDGTPWPAQLATDAYWRGDSEFVGFAWNEPDRTIAGSELPTPVAGWKLLPPQRCLKNRRRPTLPVLFQQTGRPPLRPAPTTLFVDREDSVTLASSSGGKIIQLEGAAAAAWRALLETGDQESAEQQLAQSYEVDAASLHRDLMPVWADLHQRGFLTEADK